MKTLTLTAVILCLVGCGTLNMTEEQAQSIANKAGAITATVLTPIISSHMPDDLKVNPDTPEGSDPLSGLAGGAGGGIISLAVLWFLNLLRKKNKENLVKEVVNAKLS